MEQFMAEYLPAIIAGAVGVVMSVFSYLKAKIDNAKVTERLNSIVDVLHSDNHNYYVKCPSCGHKILLAEVTIYEDSKAKEGKSE